MADLTLRDVGRCAYCADDIAIDPTSGHWRRLSDGSAWCEDLATRHLPSQYIEQCRVCGCSDLEPCEDGCWWVQDPAGLGDVCSRCAPDILPVEVSR